MLRTSIFSSLLSSVMAAPSTAAAQTPGSGGPATPGDGGHLAAILIVVVAAVVVIAVVAKAIDLRRRREDRMLQLQSQISEALLREPSLGVAVTPIVEMSLWRGSHARIEMVGHVPTEHSRKVALQIASQEAARVGVEPRLDDRLTVGRAA